MNAASGATEGMNTVSNRIKIGPFWDRAEFDVEARVVKRRFRTVARFDEVKQLRLKEFVNTYEQEQLLNKHPDVEKQPRTAELYVDTKEGRSVLLGVADQAGLLLAQTQEAATAMGVPVVMERSDLAIGQERIHRLT